MLPIFKKLISSFVCLVVVTYATAQTNTSFVTGTFTEKVVAELWVNKVVNNKFKTIARLNISPTDQNFVFAIPKDLDATYRLQINLMKAGERRPKLDRICVLPLELNPDRSYSLKITPSKLDTVKKAGWQLKQDAAKSTVAVIRGKLLNVNTKFGHTLNLQNVINGELVTNNSFETNEGEFEIPYQVKQEGFYYLSSPRWRLRVYLKPADKLELNIDGITGTTYWVNGSEENQLLYKWQQLILPLTRYGYNGTLVQIDSLDLDSYIKDYEKLEPAIAQFMSTYKVTNARFNEGFKLAMETDRELAPLFLLYNLSVRPIKGYRPRPKNFGEVPAFYHRFIQPGKFGNASLLMLGEARQYLDLYTKLTIASLPEEQRKKLSQADRAKRMMSAITNDTLKSVYFLSQLEGTEVNNLSEFRETFEPFKKYANLPEVNKKYKEVYGQYIGDTAYIGKSSYNFSLPDTSGRMVSMKDFKGKVIFIDVWATWCGPCKEQIPFFKEIEEEYKDNKDIVFVGISIDRVADRTKWINMIQKENLGGVQLLDDMGKVFARPYGINAIPRFLLIDKQGNWMEVRCPRPESKANLKRYLDKALNEKI